MGTSYHIPAPYSRITDYLKFLLYAILNILPYICMYSCNDKNKYIKTYNIVIIMLSVCQIYTNVLYIYVRVYIYSHTYATRRKCVFLKYLSIFSKRTCIAFKLKTFLGAFLVAQWLGICLPMRGTRVRALVWEDPTCRGATEPVSHNY